MTERKIPDSVVFLSDVRLSFPHLAEPQRMKNEKTGQENIKYSCDLIMPATHPGFQQFTATIGRLAAEKWKEHAANVFNMVNADKRLRCYGHGNEKVKQKTFQPYDGYQNMVYISVNKEAPPQVIQADGSPVDPVNTMAYQAITRAMYGGCRVNAAIKPWLQENSHGRGIRCELIAIQFFKDDTPFGEGVVDASSMFGAAPQASATPSPAGMPFGMPGAPVAAPAMPAAPFAAPPGLPSFLS